MNAHHLNGMRTAAANAVATCALARPDASTLVVFGAGGQVRIFQCRACACAPPHRLIATSRPPPPPPPPQSGTANVRLAGRLNQTIGLVLSVAQRLEFVGTAGRRSCVCARAPQLQLIAVGQY